MPWTESHPPADVLQRAIDDELSPAEASVLARHIEECAPCRARMTTFHARASELSAFAAAQMRVGGADTTSLRERVAASVSKATFSIEHSPWRRLAESVLRAPLALRAGVAMSVVAIGLSVLTHHSISSPGPEDTAAAATVEAGALPIRDVTPGAVSSATAVDLCASRPTGRAVVPDTVRTQILREYGLLGVRDDEYELDYLITPELGGIADRRNLWPERYEGEWNARVKDQLEWKLPQLVCEGHLDLATAQRDIAGNWIAAYRKYFHSERPIDARASRFDLDADDDGIVFAPTALVSFVPMAGTLSR
jgi:hypothetical protein